MHRRRQNHRRGHSLREPAAIPLRRPCSARRLRHSHTVAARYCPPISRQLTRLVGTSFVSTLPSTGVTVESDPVT